MSAVIAIVWSWDKNCKNIQEMHENVQNFHWNIFTVGINVQSWKAWKISNTLRFDGNVFPQNVGQNPNLKVFQSSPKCKM